MKKLSCLLSCVGTFLFVYCVISRFIHGPTVFGFMAKTVVLGANTILLLAILVALIGQNQKPDQK